jgi:hypothetical protein
MAAAYGKLAKAAESGDPDALRAALEELGALTGKGAGAAQAYEEAEKDLRELIQETAKVVLAEARLLHDLGKVLTAEQSVALVLALVEAARRHCLDPEVWAQGPMAVLKGIERDVAPLVTPPGRRPAGEDVADRCGASDDQ